MHELVVKQNILKVVAGDEFRLEAIDLEESG
jgi:hypothetical protein